MVPSTRSFRTFERATPPDADDNAAAGFSRWDLFMDTAEHVVYMCMDPDDDGDGVWRQISLPELGTTGQVLKVVDGALAYAADAT